MKFTYKNTQVVKHTENSFQLLAHERCTNIDCKSLFWSLRGKVVFI